MQSSARPAPRDKLTIHLLELGIEVSAHFNPKEIAIGKQVPWKQDPPNLSFTEAKPRALTLELFFDTYEIGESVYAAYIAKLEKGTVVMAANRERKKHPPTCAVTWGKGFPKFVGVIESLDVKYTMFFNEGTPCRATATLELTEVTRKRSADSPIDDLSDISRRRFPHVRGERDRATWRGVA